MLSDGEVDGRVNSCTEWIREPIRGHAKNISGIDRVATYFSHAETLAEWTLDPQILQTRAEPIPRVRPNMRKKRRKSELVSDVVEISAGMDELSNLVGFGVLGMGVCFDLADFELCEGMDGCENLNGLPCRNGSEGRFLRLFGHPIHYTAYSGRPHVPLLALLRFSDLK
jgi:hypothetical protein